MDPAPLDANAPPPRWHWAVLALAALACLVQHLFAWGVDTAALALPFDDAFITFRYVERAAAGLGLTYNDDAAVFGVSTPLYALWLLALRWLASLLPLGSALSEVARVGNGVLLVAFGVVLWRLVLAWWPRRPAVALLVAVLALLDPDAIAISIGGMESSLLLLLLACALHPALQARPAVFGAVAAAATLTRPEAALLFLLWGLPRALAALRANMGGDARLAVLRDLAAAALAAAALAGPWLAYALLRYGDVVPQSVRAKAAPLYPLPPGRALLDALFETGLPRLFGASGVDALVGLGVAPTVAAPVLQGCTLAALLAVARWLAGPRPGAGLWQPSALLLGWLALYGAGNPMLMTWYGPPLRLLARLLVVGVALEAATPWLGVSAPGTSRVAAAAEGRALLPRAGLALAALLWLSGSFGLPANLRRLPRSAAHAAVAHDAMRARIVAYDAAGRWLERHAPAGSRVLASEIGQLGWTYRGPILDGAGLVTPAATAFLPSPASQCVEPEKPALSREMVAALAPDYIVSIPVFYRRSIGDDLEAAGYREVARMALPTPLWGDDAVVVLRRGCGGCPVGRGALPAGSLH
jgi:hypothetical protein